MTVRFDDRLRTSSTESCDSLESERKEKKGKDEVWESKRKLSIQGPEEEETNSPNKLFKPLNQQTRLAANSPLLSPECLPHPQMVSEESEDDEEKDGLTEDEFMKTEIYMLLMKYAEEKFGPSVN
ncbi:hypothetical protein ABFA07_007073 [Porites harrisoni]